MATGTAKRVYHGTLGASTVDTITMTSMSAFVQIDNRGSTDIFVSTDGTTPTVAGAEFWVVPATSNRVLPLAVRHGVGTYTDDETGLSAGTAAAANYVVKLISSGTPAYSVTGQ